MLRNLNFLNPLENCGSPGNGAVIVTEKFGWLAIDTAPIDKEVMLIVTDGRGEKLWPFKLANGDVRATAHPAGWGMASTATVKGVPLPKLTQPRTARQCGGCQRECVGCGPTYSPRNSLYPSRAHRSSLIALPTASTAAWRSIKYALVISWV